MIGSSVMKELMFTKIDPCLNVSRICSVSIRFPHSFSLCVVYFYESVFSIYPLKVKLQALLTLPKVLLPHGVNLMGFFVNFEHISYRVFRSPNQGGRRGEPTFTEIVLCREFLPGNLLLCRSPRHPKLFWPQHSQNLVGDPISTVSFVNFIRKIPTAETVSM